MCGYRVYDDNDNNNTLLRRILHWGFGTTVRTLFWGTDMGGIRDTQCGCKLLTLAAAPRLYANLHLRRWSHDVEVLYRATRSSKTDDDDTTMLLAQAPVPWRDCAAGSRLAAEGVGRVALRMLWDIWVCRIAYAVGWWRMIVPRESTNKSNDVMLTGKWDWILGVTNSKVEVRSAAPSQGKRVRYSITDLED